jgi:hypothetical protein
MSIQSHGLILSDENVLSVMIHLHRELIAATSLLMEMQSVHGQLLQSTTWGAKDREKFAQALKASQQLIDSATLKLDGLRARYSRDRLDDGRVVTLSRQA